MGGACRVQSGHSSVPVASRTGTRTCGLEAVGVVGAQGRLVGNRTVTHAPSSSSSSSSPTHPIVARAGRGRVRRVECGCVVSLGYHGYLTLVEGQLLGLVSVAIHGDVRVVMVVVVVVVGGHVGMVRHGESVRHVVVVGRGGDVGVEPGRLRGGGGGRRHEGREGVGGVMGGGHDAHVGRRHHEGLRSLEQVHAARRRVVLHVPAVSRHRPAALVVHADHLLALLGPGADDAVDGADGRDVVLVADAVLQETVTYLPREDARVLLLVAFDLAHHLRRGHLGLAAANHSRFDGPGLKVPASKNNNNNNNNNNKNLHGTLHPNKKYLYYSGVRSSGSFILLTAFVKDLPAMCPFIAQTKRAR